MEIVDEERLSYNIDLFLSIRGTPPMQEPVDVALMIKPEGNRDYYVIGQTQKVKHMANPDFNKAIRVEYFYQRIQEVKIRAQIGHGSVLGNAYTQIAKLMGAECQTQILDLIDGDIHTDYPAKVIIRCEKVQEEARQMKVKFRCRQLKPSVFFLNFWHQTNPVIRIFKERDDRSYIPVFTTETLINTINPNFKELILPLQRLCDSDIYRKIRLACMDQQDGGLQMIGTHLTTINELEQNFKAKKILPITLNNKPTGQIEIMSFSITEKHNFISYLRGGMNFWTSVAIDFTSSNGESSTPSSLHYQRIDNPSQYFQAIRQVLRIVLDYDRKKQILALGFGAEVKAMGKGVRHCFPLSCEPGKPYSYGLQHLLNTYTQCLKAIKLSGPTHFAQVLRNCRIEAQKRKDDRYCYQVILILTDGIIHDIEETIDEIFLMAWMPISIIIIGIGKADFTAMNRLDGDDGLFNRRGEICPRDLVQFVPYIEMGNNPVRLRSEVLEELPRQVEEYFEFMKIPPQPPMRAQGSNSYKQLFGRQEPGYDAPINYNYPE